MGMPGLIELLVFLLFYLFGSYVMYKIGLKLNVKAGYGAYLVPIYPLYLLAKGANINPWIIVGLIIPYVGIIFGVYYWGKIAERLNRSFWLYGLGVLLLGIPILILAFSNKKA